MRIALTCPGILTVDYSGGPPRRRYRDVLLAGQVLAVAPFAPFTDGYPVGRECSTQAFGFLNLGRFSFQEHVFRASLEQMKHDFALPKFLRPAHQRLEYRCTNPPKFLSDDDC